MTHSLFNGWITIIKHRTGCEFGGVDSWSCPGWVLVLIMRYCLFGLNVFLKHRFLKRWVLKLSRNCSYLFYRNIGEGAWLSAPEKMWFKLFSVDYRRNNTAWLASIELGFNSHTVFATKLSISKGKLSLDKPVLMFIWANFQSLWLKYGSNNLENFKVGAKTYFSTNEIIQQQITVQSRKTNTL